MAYCSLILVGFSFQAYQEALSQCLLWILAALCAVIIIGLAIVVMFWLLGLVLQFFVWFLSGMDDAAGVTSSGTDRNKTFGDCD